MNFAKRFNKGRKFNIDTNGFEYANLEELYKNNGADFVYPLCALYINTRGMYGDAPVFATDCCFVNIPSHMIDTARDILNDVDAIDAINNGKVGFQIYTYEQSKYNRVCYGVNFVDR